MVVIYHSGTPGIRGGLPEDLLTDPVNIMTSFVEFGQGDKERIADRRLDRIQSERRDEG